MTTSAEVQPDPAVLGARRVVGLYGDPDVSWSIVLAVDYATPRDPSRVQASATDLVARYPALGAAPVPIVTADETGVLEDFAGRPYGDHEPLVRVALTAEGRTLVVAAHHGAVDGLGLLGVAAALGGVDLTSSARGIERSAEPTAFVTGSIRRLVEAVFTPPVRLHGRRDPQQHGDWLQARDLVADRVGSAALVAAAAEVLRRWNGTSDLPRRRRLIVSMGLSRRPGEPVPEPVRDTAYMRVDAGSIRSAAQAAVVVSATAPEPAFPVTDGGGIGPRVTRLLAPRLGATMLVSNLGLVRGPGVERVRFWPVPTGPFGFCVGLATASAGTTVTIRARRGWFGADAAALLADLTADRLVEAAAGRPDQ